MNNELRWQQRFTNFDKAYRNFIQIADCQLEDLSKLEKEGFVQRFEYTLELAWKTLKDYLLEQGFDLASPKEVIRQAFQNEIITDGEVWMEALSRRNLTSHTYNPEVLEKTLAFLRTEFYPVIEKMHATLRHQLDT
jgi:nucleotidyltransferase substrate binding protein (TIGR01987 family)